MKQNTRPSQKCVLKSWKYWYIYMYIYIYIYLYLFIYIYIFFFSPQICKKSTFPDNFNQAGREVFLRPLPVESTVWVLVMIDIFPGNLRVPPSHALARKYSALSRDFGTHHWSQSGVVALGGWAPWISMNLQSHQQKMLSELDSWLVFLVHFWWEKSSLNYHLLP